MVNDYGSTNQDEAGGAGAVHKKNDGQHPDDAARMMKINNDDDDDHPTALPETATATIDNDDDDDDVNVTVNPDHLVEFATLVLPSSAAQQGMEAGEGAHVVLEAEKTTVGNLVDPSSAPARLAGVVDLEILSDLLGESEFDTFISGLHQEATDRRVFEDEMATEDEEVELSPSWTGTSTAVDDEEDEERQSLLSSSSNGTGGAKTGEILSDRVTLGADPFIETLAETLAESAAAETCSNSIAATPSHVSKLPTIFETRPSDQMPSQELSTASTSDHSHYHHDGVLQEAAATKTEDHHHLAHDAFLLNIPNETSDGEFKDHFVLALPEIRADSDESVASTMSQQSDAHYFPALHKALSFLSEDLHLPSDIVSIQLEAHSAVPTTATDADTIASFIPDASVVASSIAAGSIPPVAELNLDLVVKRQVPVIGYIILVTGLFALSSVGAALALQEGPTAIVKTLWRLIATSMVLSPLVVKSFLLDGLPQLTRRQLCMLPCAGAAYAYMCAAFVVALEHTTMANAFVLSNMTSLVIILGRVLLRLPILRTEGAGTVIGFLGAAVCAQAAPPPVDLSDADVLFTPNDASEAMLGNAVALSASFATAIYLIFAKSLRSSLDIFVFMFCIMFLGAICLLLFMAVSGEDFSWGMDQDTGIFGWLHWTFDRLPLELFMAIVCNCIGTTGYIAVMKYFEPIVPASVMLMEPVAGSLLGVLAGTTPMPGAQTWIGDAIVATGTFLVIFSGAKKTEKIEATEALRPSAVGDDASTVVSLLKSVRTGRSSVSAYQRQRKLSEDGGALSGGAKVVWDN